MLCAGFGASAVVEEEGEGLGAALGAGLGGGGLAAFPASWC